MFNLHQFRKLNYIEGGRCPMKNLSDKYLEETLLQAKKFGLDPQYIQELEFYFYKRMKKSKKMEEKEH